MHYYPSVLQENLASFSEEEAWRLHRVVSSTMAEFYSKLGHATGGPSLSLRTYFTTADYSNVGCKPKKKYWT